VDEVGQSKVSSEKNDTDDSSERTALRVREDVPEEVELLMSTLKLFIFNESSKSWRGYPAKISPVIDDCMSKDSFVTYTTSFNLRRKMRNDEW